MKQFTANDKLACIRRELRYRRGVFPRRVADGRMTQAEMNRQIAVMEAIEADYVALTKVQLDLRLDEQGLKDDGKRREMHELNDIANRIESGEKVPGVIVCGRNRRK